MDESEYIRMLERSVIQLANCCVSLDARIQKYDYWPYCYACGNCQSCAPYCILTEIRNRRSAVAAKERFQIPKHGTITAGDLDGEEAE